MPAEGRQGAIEIRLFACKQAKGSRNNNFLFSHPIGTPPAAAPRSRNPQRRPGYACGFARSSQPHSTYHRAQTGKLLLREPYGVEAALMIRLCGFRSSGLPAALGMCCWSARGRASYGGGGKLCAWIRRNKTVEYFRRQALARAQPTTRRGIALSDRLYRVHRRMLSGCEIGMELYAEGSGDLQDGLEFRRSFAGKRFIQAFS